MIFIILRDWPTWLIATGLLGLMLAANELGFRAGRRNNRNETEISRTAENAFKGSIFGLVALLLGFSFSATTSRYDLRQRIVLDQSNAIGTCHQRAGLLDKTSREQIRAILGGTSSSASSFPDPVATRTELPASKRRSSGSSGSCGPPWRTRTNGSRTWSATA